MISKINFLEWDSTFFKKKIGAVNINNENQLDDKEALLYDLIYVFSENSNLPFLLVDKKIVYILDDLERIEFSEVNNISLYDLNVDSYDDLLSLTLQSGEFSRFKVDNNFSNNEYEKLYSEWLIGSINKRLATDIIVKRLDGKIVGFVTLTKKNVELAGIGLVAVDSSYRGKGIGKELIFQVISLAKSQGYKKIQVVTQLDNRPANNLYKKCGFKKFSLTFIYHIWNYDTI